MIPEGKPAGVDQIIKDPCVKLKKHVMKRLINTKVSPTYEKKKSICCKLVANNTASLVIIYLAADMDSYVDKTKDVVLNNYA